MKPANPGAAPQGQEITVMYTWPSISLFGLGRSLGQLYILGGPFGDRVLRVGNLVALLSIPVALVLYFLRVLPGIGYRYRLTNQRVIVERGLQGKEERSVALDHFDTIDIVVRPGMEWYDAGDLVFRQGATETFRLEAVSRPGAFRATCLKTHMAYVGVARALARQQPAKA